MAKKIAITFLLFFSMFSFSQCIDCFKNYGGWVNENVSDIKKNNSGISILINTQGGSYYPKIVRHDSNCNIIFERTFNSINLNLKKHIYDNLGNCYLLIDYGTAFITTMPGPFFVDGITLYRGLNLIKISQTGTFLWSRPISDLNYSTITNIFYYNNEILITGDFLNNYNINGQNLYNLPLTNNTDRTFIAKYETNGTYINSTYLDNANDEFIDSEIDSNGNIYLTKVNLSTPRSTSIVKVNNNLTIIWSNEISNSSVYQSSFLPTKLYFNNTNNKLYLWAAYNQGKLILFFIKKRIKVIDLQLFK
jgi:hypothetical protein